MYFLVYVMQIYIYMDWIQTHVFPLVRNWLVYMSWPKQGYCMFALTALLLKLGLQSMI